MQKYNSNGLQVRVEKYLPHNFLVEKIVLSSLITNFEILQLKIQDVSPEIFYFKNHQEIYKAILNMSKNNLSIDMVTFFTYLQSNGLLEKTGGIRVILELLNQIPNLAYFDEYLNLLKDKFVRRSLIKLGYEMIDSCYKTNLSLEELLTEFENKIYEASTITKQQELSSSADLINDIFLKLKKQSINPKLPGLPSGFDNIDYLTQGFQSSDFIIIAGRPSTGKTALSLNIALNAIKKSKLPVLFFSLEMSKEQIMYRLLSMEAQINQMKLKNGMLTKDDWLKLNKVLKILASLPFFIDDTFNLSTQDIRSKIKTLFFEQNELGLVIIDYIQLLQYSSLKTENRVQELSKITRALKTVAREFNIPIIGLSQLSRNVENRANKKPTLADLRESGSIEQDADLVMLLYKDNFYNNLNKQSSLWQTIELIIAKHRNGPIGTIKLEFNEEQIKFSSGSN